jgi:tetratricopeptide (TPR) repeat protein
MRAYILYDLVRSFSPAYDSQTASTDLGMPIRTKSAIDENEKRSTVEKTYEQIFSDLSQANNLLLPEITLTNKERPSKVAVTALYARIYLSMGKYDKAEQYANSTLEAYNTLIDYNNIDLAQRIPFTMNNAETILNTTVINNYYTVISVGGFIDAVTIEPTLYNMYSENDLRKDIYFGTNPVTGSIYIKFGYAGAYVNSFTGLATDEIYLIKAECLARRNEVNNAITVMNTLLKNRYKTALFIPLSAENQTEALNKILIERRKELVWRSLRWTDLKRFNKEGANITLKREINGDVYTLAPNDPKYVFPIPDDEVALSGIQQNIR